MAVPASHVERQGGPWPFITWAEVRGADGALQSETSRWRRKHQARIEGHDERTWWAPGALGWWIGVLFAFGASCFVVASLPVYAEVVGDDVVGPTYFIGSILFTAAALAQHLQAVSTPEVRRIARRLDRWRAMAIEPKRIDWWATAVQLAGTVWFNVNTFQALSITAASPAFDERVWRPDAAGSICFLVASAFAFAEVGHRWLSFKPRDLSWQIAAVNLAGSALFGVAAVAYHRSNTSGELLSSTWNTIGTLGGAVCFFVGALLLLPERTAERADAGGLVPTAT